MIKDTAQATRIIGEAAPLIACALESNDTPEDLTFSYSEYAVIVRPLNTDPASRGTNKAAFEKVGKVFRRAGWQRQITFTRVGAEVHASSPGWLPCL